MKKCKKCWVESDNFRKDKGKKDWLHSWCKVCTILIMQEYHRTKKWLSTKIYWQQRNSSKTRWHSMPKYSSQNFRKWLLSQDNFEELYNNRVKSWYKNKLAPSVDRLNDNKWYYFDNIQLMTWWENKNKAHQDMRNWKLIHWHKPQKVVIGTHKTNWKIIDFHSIIEAYRQTWIAFQNISCCCKWKLKSAWWYIWKYKEIEEK